MGIPPDLLEQSHVFRGEGEEAPEGFGVVPFAQARLPDPHPEADAKVGEVPPVRREDAVITCAGLEFVDLPDRVADTAAKLDSAVQRKRWASVIWHSLRELDRYGASHNHRRHTIPVFSPMLDQHSFTDCLQPGLAVSLLEGEVMWSDVELSRPDGRDRGPAKGRRTDGW